MNNYYPSFISIIFFLLYLPVQIIAQNNSCENATLVVPGNYEVTEFSGAGAIFQGATAAVWYRFEPTTSGVFTVGACEGGGDTRLVIMLLDDCSNTNNLQIINSAEDNCSDGKGGESASIIEAIATAGSSYVIYWDNGQSEDGFTWNLSFESAGNSDAGTICETAISINTGTHQVDTLTGVGAAFSDAVSAKWYQYKPEEEGKILAINSCESNINTRLFVFEDGCEVSQIVGQDDDGCGSTGASILGKDLIVDTNKIYYIYWDDHWSKNGFIFQLELEEFPSSLRETMWGENINVYPNPTAHVLYVDYDFLENKDLIMTIYNSLGQPMLMEKWSSFLSGKREIITYDLPVGIYYLRLNTDNDFITRQFVIDRR